MSDAQEDKSELGVSDTQAPPATAPAAPHDELSHTAWSPGHGLCVRFAGRSAVGLVREHNEDNFVIANLTSGDVSPREASFTDVVGQGGLLFAVCDGMGGAAAGEVASQMAVDVLHEAMRRGGFPRERDELARRLVGAVEEAGRRIFDAAQKERSRRGMGTTATVAVLIDKVLFIAEVGDSRAYMLRSGALKQLTKDQSLVNQLIEAGHLTEAEAEAFEHSNIILQALGTSESVQVDLTFVELRRGDRLMLCSDGLSGLVHHDTLRETLLGIDDPSECTATLVKYAEAGGGHDNITVVVIDFDGDALEPPRETDTFGYLQYPLLPAGTVAGAFGDEEVTEASSPPNRVSHESVAVMDPVEEPPSESSPWLWVSAGLLALLLGAWLLAASGSSGSATADGEHLDSRAVAPNVARPKPAETPEAKPVPVRVFSDVQDAVLLVNGESHGRLESTDNDAHTLELRPGAYRFEAQSNGNIAAVEVVTVRPDVPLEVHLKSPAAVHDPEAQHTAALEADKGPAPSKAPVPSAAASGTESAARTPAASPERKAEPPVAGEHAVPKRRKPAAEAPSSATPPAAASESAPTPPSAAPAPAATSAPAPKAPGSIPDNPF